MSLYLIALAFTFLFVTSRVLRGQLFECLQFFGSFIGIWSFGFALIAAIGLVLALLCPFNPRELGKHSKEYLLWFASAVTVFSGLALVIHQLSGSGSAGFPFVFAFWNIANCVLLIIMVKVKAYDTSDLIDEYVGLLELLIGTAVLVGLLYLCRSVWQLHWTIAFSISITYASNASNFHGKLFRTQKRKLKPARPPGKRHRLLYLSDFSDEHGQPHELE